MPTYEYECQKCGHQFELFQNMSDPPRKRCPKCRGKVQRLLGTGAGIIFKGSGFYATDYRSEGYHKSRKAEKNNGERATDGKSEKKDGNHKTTTSNAGKKKEA